MNRSTIIKQTACYGISVALMRGISIFMLPIVTRYLTPEEFGKLEILSSLAIFGSVLVGMGLEQALYRFCAIGSPKQKRQWAATTFSIAVFFGVIFCVLAYPASVITSQYLPGDIPALLISLVFFMLALEGIIAVPLGWLRMNDRCAVFCMLSTGRVVLQAICTIIFLKNGRGIAGFFEAGLLGASIQALLLSIFQIRDVGFRISLSSTKKITAYSVPIVGSGLLAFFLNGFDRWIIAQKIDIEHVAYFGIAAKFSLALTLLIQPFGMWWMPRRLEVLEGPNGIREVSRFCTLGIVLLISIFLVVGLTSPIAIEFIVPKSYHPAASFTVGLLFAVLFKESIEFINIGCFRYNNTNKQFMINGITTIIGCLALIVGVLTFKLWGVIIALVTTHFTRLLWFYIESQKHVELIYPKRRIGSLIFSVSFLVVAQHYTLSYQTSASNTWIAFLTLLYVYVFTQFLIAITDALGVINAKFYMKQYVEKSKAIFQA